MALTARDAGRRVRQLDTAAFICGAAVEVCIAGEGVKRITAEITAGDGCATFTSPLRWRR